VDATQYDGVCEALEEFKRGPRTGKPTAILCRSKKGHGGFSSFLNGHKVVIADDLMERELKLQTELRQHRADALAGFLESAELTPGVKDELRRKAEGMRIGATAGLAPGTVAARRAPVRDKQIRYDASRLPKIDKSKEYAASNIVTAAMKVFAQDARVVSIDSDLASTSGLEAGISAVDQTRALNVGVAEANMMNIGEAYAALGYNAWVSTFCPFFDWKVLRRIAVGYQERLEAIAAPDGWLSEGHGLDLTFLATAPNLETRTNGATHMGNDDVTIFDGIAHLKIIDVSCPEQLLGIMKWIMAGNRGLAYVRIMRAGSRVLYDQGFEFDFGKGYTLRQSADDVAVIVSSGRGVHEALAAAAECEKRGVKVGVVDMPSVDEALLVELYNSGKLLCFAEQNNGYLWRNFQKSVFKRVQKIDTSRAFAVNTLDQAGQPQFIHSGTYEQLMGAFGLAPAQLAGSIVGRVNA
jgi:transketolase C-terminal domain/subunit